MDKEIDTIKNMKENGAFKKYIEYIVFHCTSRTNVCTQAPKMLYCNVS